MRWRAMLAFALALTAVVPSCLAAQAGRIIVRVEVVDSSTRPIDAADVAIARGQHTLATGTTDTLGRVTISLLDTAGVYHLTARKFGLVPAGRFVRLAPGDTARQRLVLSRVPPRLDTVRVNAKRDARRASYFIDADAIARSSRPIFDAFDVVMKLRPDMWRSRAPEICNGGLGHPWPALTNVWVNGRLQRVIKRYDGLKPDDAFVREQVTEILKEIEPEHILEMHFSDCFDTTVPGAAGMDALFITLVPGVDYIRGRGTFVVPPSSSVVARVSRRAPAPRLLGVFDGERGRPIEGAIVVDSATGLRAATTHTGTISLDFLPEGSAVLHIRKLGFTEVRYAVSISPRDTVPITVVLHEVPHQ